MGYFGWRYHIQHEHAAHTEHTGNGTADAHSGINHFDPRLPSPYAQALAGVVSARQLGAGGCMAVIGHM
eukprot:2036857-Alexandrium_andersonii.AAC.1